MNTTFESWELQTRLALAKQGIGRPVVDPLIEGAKADCEESGQTPWEVVGSPQEFAAAVAAERLNGTRVGLDQEGMSLFDNLTGSVFAAAGLSIVVSICAAVAAGSFSLTVTAAGLTGSVLLLVVFVAAFGVPPALRVAGHPRMADASWALTFLLLVAAATAFVELPRTELGKVPALAVIGAAVLVMCLLSGDRWGADVAVPLDSAASGKPMDGDAWFDRLTGLLIGRHDLPRARAEELVAEARSHLAASPDQEPAAEFGPIGTYAAELAEHEPVRQPPWWRNRTYLMFLAAAFIPIGIWQTSSWFVDGNTALAICVGIPGTAGFALWTAQYWRQRQTKARPARKASRQAPPRR